MRRSHQRARRDHYDSPAPRRMSEIESGQRISTGSMITRHYADLSITAPKYADLSITEPKYADASIATPKLKDYNVTNLKIATNSGDARTQQDNSITTNYDAATGATTRSHLNTDAVGQRELQSHTTNNLLRAVGQYHVRDNFLQSRHIPDLGVPNVKIAGVTGDKLSGTIQGSLLSALADAPGNLGAARITGEFSGASIADGAISGPKIAAALKNPAQATEGLRSIAGSGTGVAAAAWNHVHSVSFKHLCKSARITVLDVRSNLRGIRDAKNTKDDVKELCRGVLALMHLAFDDETMTAEEREDRLDNDREFRRQFIQTEHLAVYAKGYQRRRRKRFGLTPHEDIQEASRR